MATSEHVVYSHIVKEPDYCGGKATIDSTRVRVNNVVWLWKEGHSAEGIREEYPGLALAQIHAALAYYYDNTAEIEAEFQEALDAAANFEVEKAEVLRELASRR
jgi:uncharacterized protein (DUF433 family)